MNGLTQIGIGLKALGSWIKTEIIEGADKTARNNPMIRVFLDSPIGSDIEKEVEKAYSAAWYKKIKGTFMGKLSDTTAISLGKLIGQGTARVLDMTKLNYQLAKGWITAIQYRNELTKRTLCGVATVIDKGWLVVRPIVKKGVKGVLEYIGMPEVAAKKATKYCTLALGLAKKEVAEFLRSKKVIEVTQNIVNTVSEGVIKVVEAGEKVSEKIAEVITNLATSTGKTAKEFIKGTKEFYKGSKTTLKKVWHKLFA